MQDRAEELRGKNPKRVASQLRYQLRLQKQRVLAHALAAPLLLAAGMCGLIWDLWPSMISIICLALIPFALLGFIADLSIARRRRRNLEEIENLLQADGKSPET